MAVGGGFGVEDGKQSTDIAEESDVKRADEVSVATGTGDVPTWTVTVGVSARQLGMDVQVCAPIAVGVHTWQAAEFVLTGPKLWVISNVVL